MAGPFLLDGGLETTLVFIDGIDLPCFASYPLLAETSGRARLRDYYRQYGRHRQRTPMPASFLKASAGAPMPTGAPNSATMPGTWLR